MRKGAKIKEQIAKKFVGQIHVHIGYEPAHFADRVRSLALNIYKWPIREGWAPITILLHGIVKGAQVVRRHRFHFLDLAAFGEFFAVSRRWSQRSASGPQV